MEPKTNEADAELVMIVADLEREFLELCEDRLNEVDEALETMRSGKTSCENEILEIKRHIHSLKGMGKTFGYSSITLMAHTLEDYFETLFEFSEEGIYDVQFFADRIREISVSEQNWPDDVVSQIVRDMPLRARRRTVRRGEHALSILVLMPKGLQRKIVVSELSQFGFNVLIAEDSFDAIEKGIRRRPDLFMSSAVAKDISGLELAGVFHAIKATSHHPFLLVTSSPIDEDSAKKFPPNVTVLHKGSGFARDLMAFFKAQGYKTN